MLFATVVSVSNNGLGLLPTSYPLCPSASLATHAMYHSVHAWDHTTAPTCPEHVAGLEWTTMRRPQSICFSAADKKRVRDRESISCVQPLQPVHRIQQWLTWRIILQQLFHRILLVRHCLPLFRHSSPTIAYYSTFAAQKPTASTNNRKRTSHCRQTEFNSKSRDSGIETAA